MLPGLAMGIEAPQLHRQHGDRRRPPNGGAGLGDLRTAASLRFRGFAKSSYNFAPARPRLILMARATLRPCDRET